jgi:hypothetical protein
MSQVEPRRPVFVDSELGDVVEHRPVSKLAVVAVVLAIISPLAIATRVMWLVPLLGLIVSLLALWSVRRSERRPYGRKAAVISLLVTLFVLGCAPTRYLIQRRLVMQQSRQHAETWFQIALHGNLPRAHQLTKEFGERLPRGTDLEMAYAADSADRSVTDPRAAVLMPSLRQTMDSMFKQPPISEILAAGPKAKPRYVRTTQFGDESATGLTTVKMRYDIEYEEDGVSHVIPIEMVLERQIEFGRGIVVWRVANLHAAS